MSKAHALTPAGATSPILRDRLEECAHELGCDAVGVARARPVAARDRMLAWLAAGYAAEMAYLHAHQDQRSDPRRLLPGAQSVVVVGLNYGPRPATEGPFKVAGYAWGEDYHRVLRRILRRLRTRLRAEFGGFNARICVDTAPFPDKYWAVEAGLGWQGKHTNVVSRRHGSYLLLGSLVVDRPFDRYDRPHEDFCGTCDECLAACPTRAFPAPYVLDAGRCLSYLTIEYRGKRLPGAPENPSRWVFGCDDCLDACPWNRFASEHVHPAMARRDEVALVESGDVRSLSEEEFSARFAGSALTRAGRDGLARNLAAFAPAPAVHPAGSAS